ncbi:hypothetical protein BpHYR1_016468 [Brachionus plicatilis]|uniref:Uncharacterized protein n=1 Tax=Brachionus plicatilis TaxID=10195 RepID=A0A3M7PNM7_BRAPC|nr:hypothetical protein BpHYR1_016468 [Brachionus plicatilis]
MNDFQNIFFFPPFAVIHLVRLLFCNGFALINRANDELIIVLAAPLSSAAELLFALEFVRYYLALFLNGEMSLFLNPVHVFVE